MTVRLKLRVPLDLGSRVLLEIITVNGHTLPHPIPFEEWLEEKKMYDGLPFDIEVEVPSSVSNPGSPGIGLGA